MINKMATDGADVTGTTISYRAVQHPIPELFRKQLIEAGKSRDMKEINRIEHILRCQGPRVEREVMYEGE